MAQSWADTVTVLATTALRISEVSGLRVGDIDLGSGLLHVFRPSYPGRGGLVTKQTKGRRRRTVPIIDPLRPTLVRLTAGRQGDDRHLSGPRGGVITTATLRDATGWDELVKSLGLSGLVRHGLRHTALTWMADAGVDLHILQRVAGHQDPAVTSRYLHPDTQAMPDAGTAFSAWWSGNGPAQPTLGVIHGGRVLRPHVGARRVPAQPAPASPLPSCLDGRRTPRHTQRLTVEAVPCPGVRGAGAPWCHSPVVAPRSGASIFKQSNRQRMASAALRDALAE